MFLVSPLIFLIFCINTAAGSHLVTAGSCGSNVLTNSPRKTVFILEPLQIFFSHLLLTHWPLGRKLNSFCNTNSWARQVTWLRFSLNIKLFPVFNMQGLSTLLIFFNCYWLFRKNLKSFRVFFCKHMKKIVLKFVVTWLWIFFSFAISYRVCNYHPNSIVFNAVTMYLIKHTQCWIFFGISPHFSFL